MMLSPRRFWCVACICVLVICAMLVAPVKQYAKRTALKFAFGSNLSASDFKLHRQQDLLEVNELKTAQSDDTVRVEASAELAYVKLDMPTLLDKRFISSRVRLQGVRLELTSLPIQKPATTAAKSWQKSLEETLLAFQWDHLRDECEALLKSDSVLSELEQRMRAWLLRSQQIMFHGDQLTRTIQGYSNPLRHQNDIKNQLAQIEQLQAEQVKLQKQFGGVDDVLANQLNELRSIGGQDVASIQAKSESQLKSLQTRTAEQLVSEWAKQLTARQLQLSQSVATLLQHNSRSNPYDVDVRSPHLPWLAVSGVEAEGVLCDAAKDIPFSALGEYTTVHKVNYKVGRKTNWEIKFDVDQVTTQLLIAANEKDAAWSIKSTSSEGQADSDSGAAMLNLEASLSDRQLYGKARMNLGMYHALTKLRCSGNADLTSIATAGDVNSAMVAVDEDWIEFTLSGTSLEPCVTLVSNLPDEFTRTITTGIREKIESQRIDSESKLKVALESKLDEITRQIELVAKNGQQTLAQQRETLNSMHHALEQTLVSRDGFEYARLPNKSNTSR
jgi:hypothetical protein